MSENVEHFFLPFLSTFGVMLLAEFGDKTNLITLSLASKSKQPLVVAVGGMIGIGLISIIGVLIGSIAGQIIPIGIVNILAGIIFLWMGISELQEEDEEEEPNSLTINELSSKIAIFRAAIVLVAIAEFGDKSQLFVISQAAIENPFAVFLGALLGMGVIIFLSAYFGDKVLSKVPEHILSYLIGAILIVAGLWFIVSGILLF